MKGKEMGKADLRVKLTHDEVRIIKEWLSEGMTQAQAARRMRLAQTHISRIARGEAWPLVPWPDGSTGPQPKPPKAPPPVTGEAPRTADTDVRAIAARARPAAAKRPPKTPEEAPMSEPMRTLEEAGQEQTEIYVGEKTESLLSEGGELADPQTVPPLTLDKTKWASIRKEMGKNPHVIAAADLGDEWKAALCLVFDTLAPADRDRPEAWGFVEDLVTREKED